MSTVPPPKLLRTLLAACLLAPALVYAQGTPSSPSAAPPSGAAEKPAAPSTGKDKAAAAEATSASSEKLSRSERKFIEDAARDGAAEVELAKLAQQKASSDAVKRFADKIAKDHEQANSELKQVAESKGIAVPAEMDRKHQRLMSKLEKASGASFDRDYMKAMVSDHRRDIKDFQKEAQKAKDADVRGFAEKTLPTLREHEQLAAQTYAEVSGKSARGASGSAVGGTSPQGAGSSSMGTGTGSSKDDAEHAPTKGSAAGTPSGSGGGRY